MGGGAWLGPGKTEPTFWELQRRSEVGERDSGGDHTVVEPEPDILGLHLLLFSSLFARAQKLFLLRWEGMP